MTSIAEARNCSFKLEDRNVLNNSNYIVTESIEFTEDEPHNISFISELDKSELDIELEICEEILRLDDDGTSTDSNEQLFEYIDLENIFDSPESVLEIQQGAGIDGSYQQGSQNIKLECADIYESAVQSNVETCNDPAKEQLFDNDSKPVVCKPDSDNKKSCNSQDLPSSSKVSEEEFDFEIKKCCDILKDEEPSDTDATDHLSQIPLLPQFNNTTNSSHILTEKEIKKEKIEEAVPAETIVKSEKVTIDASVHLDQVLLPAQFTNTANSLKILMEKEIKSEHREMPVPVEARSPVKDEESSDTDATGDLSQIPLLPQFNNTTNSSHISTENIEASVPAETIVKSEKVTICPSVHLDQGLLPAQFTKTTNSLKNLMEKEIKSENKERPVPVEATSPVKLEDIPLPVSEGSTEKMRKKRNCEESPDSDSISIVYESDRTKAKKLKSVIHVPNLNMEVREKDDDELSLFAETDITVEEEYEEVEGLDSPQYSREHSDSEQDDARNKKVSPRSVVVVPETDYLQEEREDINDSGWESMKNLSSEEERYEFVRKTWMSSSLPNPNRNLTCHSYRKRHLKKSSAQRIARKRKATSSLDDANANPPKRQRSCTYLYDINIDFLSTEMKKQKAVLKKQMQSEVNHLNNIYFQKEQNLKRDNHHRRNNSYEQIYDLRHRCQQERANIKQQYNTISSRCTSDLDSGIDKLNQARNEVLQFFSFYKGLNSEDPTVLSNSQLTELEDIENIYLQFDKFYKG